MPSSVHPLDPGRKQADRAGGEGRDRGAGGEEKDSELACGACCSALALLFSGDRSRDDDSREIGRAHV